MTTTLPDVKTIERNWLLVDATDQPLGRLASQLVALLRGKHKVTFTPFFDTGDFVVVIHADKVKVTGQKRAQKQYTRYTGYPGGLRTMTMDDMFQKHPDRVITKAVNGMMPDGPLGRKMMTKLKVYAGANHPHQAQRPVVWTPPARGLAKKTAKPATSP